MVLNGNFGGKELTTTICCSRHLMSTIKYKNSGGYQNLCATAVLPRKKKKEKRKKEKEKERLKSACGTYKKSNHK